MKQVAGAKNRDFKTYHHPRSISRNQTKKYEGLKGDDPSVMQVSAVPHSDMLAVQGQRSQYENNLASNQIQDMNAPILN